MRHRRGVKQVKLSRAKQIGSLSPFLMQEITNLFFLLITYIILFKSDQPALNMTNLSHWILLFNLFNSFYLILSTQSFFSELFKLNPFIPPYIHPLILSLSPRVNHYSFISTAFVRSLN